MKKILAFVLALVVVFSLTAVAFAETGSVTAEKTTEDGTKATALPTVAENTEVKLVAIDEIEELPEEAQEAVKEAQETLEAAVPEGMEAQYFFYAESEVFPYELTVTMENVKDAKDFAGKLFINGEWVELEYVLNDDGTITITIPENGPVALFAAK